MRGLGPLVVLMAAIAWAAPVQAAPADLDSSFDGDGKLTTNFGVFDQAFDVALQPDGKIVVVGRSGGDFGIARYLPGGTLDMSFSGDGKQTTDFGGGSDRATSVAVQPDGKIVAAGGSGDQGETLALARYLPGGAPDTSFSGDGEAERDFLNGDGCASGASIALQPNGRIVGALQSGAFCGYNVVRYLSNGNPDTSFSGDGAVTTNLGGDFANSRAVALQPDGKILAAGSTGDSTGFGLIRYLPGGTLDASFGDEGIVSTGTGGGGAARAVALQPDGKIVAAGTRGDSNFDGDEFALIRYLQNGDLDGSFKGGVVTTDFGADEQIGFDMAIQPNGKIVTAGSIGTFPPGGGFTLFDFALTRHLPNGSPDPSFSGDGKLTTDFMPQDVASGVALQPDGRIVAAGLAADFEQSPVVADFAVARYVGDAVPLCAGRRATIVGSGTVRGTDGADVIVGSEDVDRIEGNGGDDVICAQGHNDVVAGHAGNDEIYGEVGHDDMNGGPGNDLLEGGPGSDMMQGFDGADLMRGGDLNDTMFGQNGNDNLQGENGNDRLDGGANTDTCTQGPGTGPRSNCEL